MVLEHRYMVLKHSDIDKYLTGEEKIALAGIYLKIENCRVFDNKLSLWSVVIEQDWPEYQPTVDLLSARVDAIEPRNAC